MLKGMLDRLFKLNVSYGFDDFKELARKIFYILKIKKNVL